MGVEPSAPGPRTAALLFLPPEVSPCFNGVGFLIGCFFLIHAVVRFFQVVFKGEGLGGGVDAPAEGGGGVFWHLGHAFQCFQFLLDFVCDGRNG